MTVAQNLEMGAYSLTARERRHETLEEVFELLPLLRKRRDQLAVQLSGGEQQMCAIARGLMARPRLLMLDEPSLGLRRSSSSDALTSCGASTSAA